MIGLISKMLFLNLPVKTFKISICLFTFSSLGLFFSHPGFAQEPIEVTADQLEMTDEKDMVIGKGNVNVYHKDMHVEADKIKVNSKTGNTNDRFLIKKRKAIKRHNTV